MTDIVPFNAQISAIDALEFGINEIGKDEAHKAYLLGIALGKLSDRIKKSHNDGFKKYYDTFKELPGGFEAKTSTRRTYQFDQDPVWAGIKATLDAREATIKAATDLAEKNGTFTDPNTGEIVDPVAIKYAEVYSVTRA